MLISISGIDCSGKTTLAKLLAERLRAYVLTFPDRSTPSGKAIDQALRLEARLPPEALASLFAVNRLEKLPELRAASGSSSRHVVCCRYTPDAHAYGQLDGLDLVWLRTIDRGVPSPDLAVLLQVDPMVANERLHERPTRERYERSVPQLLHAALKLDNIWREQTQHASVFSRHWLKITEQETEERLARIMERLAL